MRVKRNRGELVSRAENLEDALTPVFYERDGLMENLEAKVEATREAMGRLLAKLVEKKSLTLDEAAEVAGVSGELIPIEDG